MPKGQKLQLPDVPEIKMKFEVGDLVVERLEGGVEGARRITTIVSVDDRDVCKTAEGGEYSALTGGRIDRSLPYRAIRFAGSGDVPPLKEGT